MNAALESVRAKRLIFTITTGRSGTEYLAKVLGAFPGVRATHEPKPTFGSAFRSVCAEPSVAREFWLAHKLPRIARTHASIYAETSHLVCKGFLESALELGLRPQLVHLVRPAREVATSLWRLGTIPGRTFGGVKYYLSPFDTRVMAPVARERAERFDDYQLCYWYCLEIEARAARYAQQFAPHGVSVTRIELAQLANSAGVEGMAHELALDAPSPFGRLRLNALIGRKLNEKNALKRASTFDAADLDEREADVRAALAASHAS